MLTTVPRCISCRQALADCPTAARRGDTSFHVARFVDLGPADTGVGSGLPERLGIDTVRSYGYVATRNKLLEAILTTKKIWPRVREHTLMGVQSDL